MVSSGKREMSTAVPAAPPAYVDDAWESGRSEGELNVSRGMAFTFVDFRKTLTMCAEYHTRVRTCG